MQLNQLRYFLEVARTKNISAAAQNLFISQPSLSQQIRNLETELGIPLLIRHPKNVSLTDAGEQFVIHAERIINSSDQLVSLMQKHSQLMAGTIKIGMTLISGYLDLFHLLQRFHTAMPNIDYELTIKMSGELMDLLQSRTLHAAFVINTENNLKQHPELYYHEIGQDDYVALIPKSNPLSERKELGIEDFQDETVIMPSRRSVFYRQLELLFQTNGVTPKILCENSDSNILSQLIKEELGIGFASRIIANKICPPNVTIVPFLPEMKRTIYYVTLRESLDYPSIEAFSSFVQHYVF